MRNVSTKFRRQIEAIAAADPLVMFAEVYAADLLDPVRVNSDVADYIYAGVTWIGCGFSLVFLSDDERPPRARVSIPNVDRRIGAAARAVPSVRLNLHLMLKSDFDDNDPRQPIGTPVPEYSARHLWLRNVSCDALALSGELTGPDLAAEPWPKIRSTPDLLPGLYR
ncbi:MAG TPA: hypothetical protein VNK48_08085 [Xanthobacteraceae bacterium]|nr:hypothetical protein [Xanthobacteraceae bacterium]